MIETFRDDGNPEMWLDRAEAALPTADLRLHTISARATLALGEGRYVDAIGHCESAWQIMSEMPGVVPMDAPCWLVWALAVEGRPTDAKRVLAQVRAMPDLERWQSRPLLLDTAEALMAGDHAAIDEMIDASRSWLWKYDVGLMRLLGAELAPGDTRVRWLREAYDIYNELGMVPMVQRIRGLLREAGAPVPRKRRAEPDVPEDLAARGVTAREAEVLRLVGDGLSNAEIADRLVVSVRTVEAHVSSLLAKLEVERRAQLVAHVVH